MSKYPSLHRQILDLATRIEQSTDLPADLLNEIETCLIHLAERITTAHQPLPSTHRIKIWSDGACQGNPGPGGWGTVIKENGQYRELSGYRKKTTNNIMELTAALEGIRKTPQGATIVLTSDSQYLVKGMTQWMPKWKRQGWKKADGNPVLNADLWKSLDAESQCRNITWQWIKGHAGHPENERCDQLARREILRNRSRQAD